MAADVSKLPSNRTYMDNDGQMHAYPFGGIDQSPTVGDASAYPDPGGANTYEEDGEKPGKRAGKF